MECDAQNKQLLKARYMQRSYVCMFVLLLLIVPLTAVLNSLLGGRREKHNTVLCIYVTRMLYKCFSLSIFLIAGVDEGQMK